MPRRPTSGPEDIPTEAILDMIEGRLDEHDAARVAAAIDGSPVATDRHDWLSRFVKLSNRVVVETPPPLLRDRLRGLGAELPASQTPVREATVDRLIAALRFDSWAPPTADMAHRDMDVLIQSTLGDNQRHLLFSADDVDVALDIYWDADDVQVLGQVMTDDSQPMALLAIDQVGDEFALEVSPTGEFVVPAAVCDVILLRVDLDGRVVNIGPFDPRASADNAG